MRSFCRIVFLLIVSIFMLPVVFVSQTHDRQLPLLEQVKILTAEEKYKEALELLQPALEEQRKVADWKPFCDIAVAISKSWYNLARYDTACMFLEKEIQYLSTSGQGERLEMGALLNNLAVNYTNQEQYIKAFDAYQKAIKIFEKNGSLGIQPAYAYKNIAQTYVRWSNSSVAVQFFDTALKVDTSGYFHAEIYSLIANHYHFIGDETSVLRYYELGMADPNRDEETTAHLQAAGASAMIAGGRLKEASQMLQTALKYYEKDRKSWEDNIITALTMLAKVAIQQQQPQVAIQYFHRADEEVKQFYSEKSREVAKLYIETGLFYENTKQPDRALSCYQKALIQAFPNFNSTNIADNPALSEAWLESQAMRAAAAKAQLLLKVAVTKKEATALRTNAAHCFDLSFAVASRLRHTYGNDADKIALSANNRSAYQAAVLNLWRLWNDTKATRHLEHLFALIEQTKAQSLADALQQQKALALSGIPDSLLRQEASLRLEAAAAAKAFEGQEFAADSSKNAQAKLLAFRQKKAYDDFIALLGEQYPQFRQFTEADASADILLIRRVLPDSTMLLSWFDAGDRYLCIRLKGNEITASEVARDSVFDASLSGFIGLCSDLNRQQESPAGFFNAAHAMYRQLFPAFSFDGIKSLVIVPDGLMCYLPFEVLLYAPHDQGTFGTAPYLFRKADMYYSWTAKLLSNSITGVQQHGFAQFAPFTNTARAPLAVLQNSLDDVPGDLSSTVLEGTAATKDHFLSEAPRHNVLHLSTHAHAGKDGAAGIEFFDQTLTTPEIYAQRIKASLVSLSACETGAGNFARGEGVLSLARAFAYAGAQSMVASLWSVNDRATAALFTGFYKNLKKGMSKSKALQQAKTDFLASGESDARKAPYYWAAFTLTGANGTVDMSNDWLGLWTWGLGALILSMAIFWGFRTQRKRVV